MSEAHKRPLLLAGAFPSSQTYLISFILKKTSSWLEIIITSGFMAFKVRWSTFLDRLSSYPAHTVSFHHHHHLLTKTSSPLLLLLELSNKPTFQQHLADPFNPT